MELMDALRNDGERWFFEIETNGTRMPGDAFLDAVDQMNVSPKLANSGISKKMRLKSDVLAGLAGTRKAWFKFVVQGEGDVEEVMGMNMPLDRVILMPRGEDGGRSGQERSLAGGEVPGYRSEVFGSAACPALGAINEGCEFFGTFSLRRGLTGGRSMKVNDENEWSADDSTWKLLGKAKASPASTRFADDTVRAIKLLPEADPWWPKILSVSPWVAAAACCVLTASILMNHPDKVSTEEIADVAVSSEEKWVAIAEVAEAEMLVAAANDLDSFSDQELASLVGF